MGEVLGDVLGFAAAVDLGHANVGGHWPRPLLASVVPRESPPNLARLWHGKHLIRSSGEIVQQWPYRPLRGPGRSLGAH